MKKRVLAVMLSAAMALALPACSGTADSNGTGKEQASTEKGNGEDTEKDDASGEKESGDDTSEKKESGDDASGEKESGDDASGEKESGDDAVGLSDCSAKITDYVELGEYDKVKIKLENTYSTTPEAVKKYINETLITDTMYVKDASKKKVEKDSIVNVDYVGKKDGKAFDGGSAENVTLDVKNNCNAGGGTSYIKGFTKGLAGAKVGKKVDCKVKFPDDYGNEELNGQKVTFTFKINYICKPLKYDDDSLTVEDYTANFSDFDGESVDDFYNYAKSKLRDENDRNKNSEIQEKVLDTVVKNAKVTVPKSVVDVMYKAMKKQYEKQYESMGMQDAKMKDILKQYGMTVKEFKKTLEDQIKEILVFTAVAEDQKIEAEGDGLTNYLQNYQQSLGVDSEDALYENDTVKNGAEGYGMDPKDYMKFNYRMARAVNYCIENAVVENAK